MISKETVRQIVEAWIEEAGDFFPVDLKVAAGNLISIEIESERGSVNIDDCAALNNYIEARLNREEEDYSLEISSAGIGQPFKVYRQFVKHIGKDVEVSLRNGQRFVGVLQSADEASFCVNVMRKVKPEGAKRPVMQPFDEVYRIDEVNSICYHLDF